MNPYDIDKSLAGFAGKEIQLDAAGIELSAAAADGVLGPLDLAGLTVSVQNADERWVEVGGSTASELKTLEVGGSLDFVVEIEGPNSIYFVRVRHPDEARYTVSVAKDY